MHAPDKLQQWVKLTASVVTGDWQRLKDCRTALHPHFPDRAWREALLQCHLFVGFPRLVEAVEVVRRAGGLGSLDPDESGPSSVDLLAGRALFDRIYADQSEAVIDRIATSHAHLADWVLEHAYSRVMIRPGLEAGIREVLAVVSLALTKQTRQLASHTRGALRCGATPQQLEQALIWAEDFFNPPDFTEAFNTVQRWMDVSPQRPECSK